MATRAETHALARRVPYFLERGVAQTITCPIRYGASGALVAPTVAGSSITIVRPAGTDLVTAAAVTVPSAVASYDITPAATEALGEGYEVRWTLVISGYTTSTWRLSAYMCKYVPPNTISAVDLYTALPELEHRIPQAQGPRGSDVGWQPQIDAAYHELLQRLIDDAHRPWLIREATGYASWLLARTLQLCIRAIEHGPESAWAQRAKDLHFEATAAASRMRLQYDSDPPTLRRAGGPVVSLAPPSRVY